MSKQKIAVEDVRIGTRPDDSEGAVRNTVPNQQLQVLALELEEDGGGDPYNRTGQFCVIDLKNKEQ